MQKENKFADEKLLKIAGNLWMSAIELLIDTVETIRSITQNNEADIRIRIESMENCMDLFRDAYKEFKKEFSKQAKKCKKKGG